MTVDPNTLGLEANALVEKYSDGESTTRLGRQKLHDAFLELLVKIANLEAELREERTGHSTAANDLGWERHARAELTRLATVVVKRLGDGSDDPGCELDRLSAYLKGTR